MSESFFAQWVALIIFAFVSSGTPGPNNIMLATSGAHFGFQRSIATGVMFMLGIVGIAQHLSAQILPIITPVLRIVSFVVVLWLAYRICWSADCMHGNFLDSFHVDHSILDTGR